MLLKLKDGRVEEYTGAAEIDFKPNENVTVRTTDGLIIDVFADGTYQVWSAPTRTAASVLLGQGDFHNAKMPAAETEPADAEPEPAAAS